MPLNGRRVRIQADYSKLEYFKQTGVSVNSGTVNGARSLVGVQLVCREWERLEATQGHWRARLSGTAL